MCARNRALSLCAVMTLAMLAGGCWEAREIENAAFVMQLGIDRHPNGDVILSAQVAVPEFAQQPGLNGENGGGAPFYVATASGPTIHRAFIEQGAQHTRRGLRAHATGIVIGEELAREGLLPFTDFVVRDRQIRYTARMYVADGEARTLLSIVPAQNPKAWEYLQGLSDQAANRGHAPRMRVHEFNLAFARPGEDLILPRLAVVPVQIEPLPLPPVPSDDSGHPQDTVPMAYTLEARGAAIFRADRMVGWLSSDEVLGVLWVRGLGLRNTVVAVEIDDEYGRYHVSLEPFERTVRIKPQFGDDHHLERLIVEISVDVNLIEVTTVVPTFTSEWLASLASPLALEIQSQVEESIRVAKSYEADVFGFGEAVRRSLPQRAWDDLAPRWQEEFVRAPIEVRVEANVRRTGKMVQTLAGQKR